MNGHKRKISKTIIYFRKQIKHINSQNNIALNMITVVSVQSSILKVIRRMIPFREHWTL